jgi:transposase
VKALEIAGKARRQRRTFTREFKRDLVHQTLVPGASISGIALANGLNTNQLFAWRRRLLPQATVRPAVLLPVEMEAAGPMVINSPADLAPAKPSRPGPGPCIGSRPWTCRPGHAAHCPALAGAVIGPGVGTRVWIAAGVTDLRRGMNGLSALVQTALEQDPFSGHVFAFRGRRGDMLKLLWWSGDGLCLFVKRLERGRFIWPQATSGGVCLTQAQLSMLLEGIDWRHPVRTAMPTHAA